MDKHTSPSTPATVKPSRLSATQRPESVRISNGQLSLVFEPLDRGYTQKLEVADSRRTILDAGGRDLQLGVRGAPVGLVYDQVRVVDLGKDHARVRCRMGRPEYEVTTIFSLLQEGPIEVRTTLAARTETPLTSIEHRYWFDPGEGADRNSAWDFLWLPNLKRRRSQVIGQHVFRSPALIIQRDDLFAAMVPDLESIEDAMPLPAALDFRRPAELRYGLVAHRRAGHVYYERERRRQILLRPGQSVRFGFTLLAGEGQEGGLGFRNVLRYLWRRYGENLTDSISPQTLSNDDYARYAYENFFDRYRVWQGFEVEGQPVGGISMRAKRPNLAAHGTPPPAGYVRRVLLQYLFSPALSLTQKLPFLLDTLRDRSQGFFFGVWFNNLRTAYGMAHFGRRWGEERLIEAADRIVSLVLASPAPAGLIPLAFVGSARRPAWLPGSRAFFLSSDYGTADMAETGLWLLAHARDFAGTGSILERCRQLGDAFLEVQERDGSIPGWLSLEGNGSLRPAGPLRTGATTAAAGRFLARLAHTTGDARYADAACRAADHVIQCVWPTQEWFDFETFFSFSSKSLSFRDAESRLPPQSTLAMAWSADLLAQVYLWTHQEKYLRIGAGALDLLLLFQQVWDAPFLSYPTFGGFGVMNTDAEWNDARQALFVPLLLTYYEITGEDEYFHRAVAALRAAFTLMHVPENERQATGNSAGVTLLDYGAMPQSYGRGGEDRKSDGFIYPDWGSGSACSIAAWVQRHYGDLYVDGRRGKAFGINGCHVWRAHVSKRIVDLQIERLAYLDEPAHLRPLPKTVSRGLLIQCHDLPATEMSLWVNNHILGEYTDEELRAGVLYYPPSFSEESREKVDR